MAGLTGIPKVLKNLNEHLREMKIKITKQGMHRAVLFVETKAKIYTPVRTGNLIGSYETNVIKKGDQVVGEIKNHASYAIRVHEAPPSTNWKKPGAKSKFLEDALFENKKQIFNILRESAKIK